MISLAVDLRESSDSLDTILKRHGHNLKTAMGLKPAQNIPYTRDEILQMDFDEKYVLFKEVYFKRLDLNAVDIIGMLNIQYDDYNLFITKIRRETGKKRYYNRHKQRTMIINVGGGL